MSKMPALAHAAPKYNEAVPPRSRVFPFNDGDVGFCVKVRTIAFLPGGTACDFHEIPHCVGQVEETTTSCLPRTCSMNFWRSNHMVILRTTVTFCSGLVY